ncbi:hypothetical protein B0H17DRAFT_1148797 [Mycena rosella]|uniref:Uncharacterized protein n=1 Tax=Mycena rosella TaxID=1033263 RepID=A0AAD7FTX6_MYCRO|nr:hypothetical protein B0H17DRAFT_1148797 [Mycena rosella]
MGHPALVNPFGIISRNRVLLPVVANGQAPCWTDALRADRLLRQPGPQTDVAKAMPARRPWCLDATSANIRYKSQRDLRDRVGLQRVAYAALVMRLRGDLIFVVIRKRGGGRQQAAQTPHLRIRVAAEEGGALRSTGGGGVMTARMRTGVLALLAVVALRAARMDHMGRTTPVEAPAVGSGGAAFSAPGAGALAARVCAFEDDWHSRGGGGGGLCARATILA